MIAIMKRRLEIGGTQYSALNEKNWNKNKMICLRVREMAEILNRFALIIDRNSNNVTQFKVMIEV